MQKYISESISLSVATLGLIGLHYSPFVNTALCFIYMYAFIDSFYTKKRDMLLHHILVILFSQMNLHPLLQEQIINDFLRLEYSTIFLSSRPLLIRYLSAKKESDRLRPNSHPIVQWIPTINTTFHIAFAGTFVKYRIYGFGMNIILNEHVYSHMYYQGTFHYLYCILIIWSFYALNLYWFQLILLQLKTKKLKTPQMIKQ